MVERQPECGPPDYVLEHEQIHFALYELGARPLNASVGRIADDVRAEGSTLDEVRQHADYILRRALVDALAVILERNRAFDEDTSLGYKPERQKAWLSRVAQELSSTQLLARSGRAGRAGPADSDRARSVARNSDRRRYGLVCHGSGVAS